MARQMRPAKRRPVGTVHPYLQRFIETLRDYRQQVIRHNPEMETDPRFLRTLTAIVLKGCFLKLAHERQFLVVETPQLFLDLLKLRRRRPLPSNQVEMWQEERVRVAVDHLLEDLELDSRVVARARINTLFHILNEFRLDILDSDILGAVYQGLTAGSTRKASGQYYTPPILVESLLDAMDLDPVADPDLRVLDPACGSGQFLLCVYDRLKKRLMEDGLSPRQAHRRILERHLFGFDNDPFAPVVARMNLFLKERSERSVGFNIHRVDTLAREEFRLELKKDGKHDYQGFDAVVGNPPWGSSFSTALKKEYKSRYESARSGVNSFTLFIERALELVRPGGRVAFVVPEAYLNIRAHRTSRRLLLRTSAIEQIATCGDVFEGVFAPAMLLLTRREVVGDPGEKCIRVIRNLDQPSEVRLSVRQSDFEHTPENILNIHLDADMRRILSKIASGAANLSGYAHFGLGLVTGDNSRLVSREKLSEDHEPLIVGTDVERYSIAASSRWIVYDKKHLQQACPRDIFEAPQKLVYRFINKRLTFACDEEGRFTLNSANILVPHLPGFRVKYLLALLNSPVIQFYYWFNFFTVKVLRGNLERLPLRFVPDARQRAIETFVDKLAGLEGDDFIAARLAIERDVFSIYGLDGAEQSYILKNLAAEFGGEPAPKKMKMMTASAV